jgi:hypothetical protein
MKNILQKLMIIAMIGLVSVSFLQMAVLANEPACVGLVCYSDSDCGSKCKCDSTQHCEK